MPYGYLWQKLCCNFTLHLLNPLNPKLISSNKKKNHACLCFQADVKLTFEAKEVWCRFASIDEIMDKVKPHYQCLPASWSLCGDWRTSCKPLGRWPAPDQTASSLQAQKYVITPGFLFTFRKGKKQDKSVTGWDHRGAFFSLSHLVSE